MYINAWPCGLDNTKAAWTKESKSNSEYQLWMAE